MIKEKKMGDLGSLEEVISTQSQVIAVLALRVNTLESLLLSKGVFTEDELVNKTSELSDAFVKETKEILKNLEETKQGDLN